MSGRRGNSDPPLAIALSRWYSGAVVLYPRYKMGYGLPCSPEPSSSANPGDIVVGDRNGVCVVPPEYAEQVLRNAQEKADKLALLKVEIERTGKVIPNNFAEQMAKLGY